MSVTFVSGGASASGTTSAAPTIPAGAVGDLLVLCVANKYPTNAPSTPSGWIAPTNNQATGGAGAAGLDAGTVYSTIFVRVADGTEGATVTVSVTSGNSMRAFVCRYRAPTLGGYDYACTGGSDNSAGTSWSVTGAANPGITAGDMVVVCSAANADTQSFSSEAVSATGITWGTSNERTDAGWTDGDDGKIIVSDHPATSGTASAAPVFTMTASGTSGSQPAGASVFLRIREATIPAVYGAFVLDGQPTNDAAAAGSFVMTGGATADPAPRQTLIIPGLPGEILAAPHAVTKRWFRNGVAPPGPASKRLGDGLNVLLARRGRVLFSKRNTYALHSNFDSADNSDLTTWRGAFHTGPTTRKVRMRMVLLPLPGDVVISTDAYVQWTLRTGLTGAGVATTQARIVDAGLSSSASFTADETYTVEQEWEVAADAHYRVELHQVNRARPLSAVIYEVPRTELQTDQDPGVDVSSIYVNGPIVRGPLDAMMEAADLIWRIGHPLGAWCTDLPADVLARTLTTLRNAFDQTVTAPSSTSPGWPIEVPYSGSLESGEVPVVLWAYASCVSGTGTIEWRDQDDNVIGSVAPAGAAAWYATTGVLGDAAAAVPTTKIDPFIAGDATHALNVYAAGLFMHEEER